MKKINKYKIKKIAFFVVKIFENIVLTLYKYILYFTPALIMNLYNYNFLSTLCLIAGIIKLYFDIFKVNSIKELYMKIKWLSGMEKVEEYVRCEKCRERAKKNVQRYNRIHS